MIVPDLAVTDLPRALAFWRDVPGVSPRLVVGPDRTMQDGPEGGVFASLEREGHEVMLQTAESPRAGMPEAVAATTPRGTLYLRGLNPDPVLALLPEGHPVRPPARQWCGMREAHVRDPDGHIICPGIPDGPPPG